MKIYPNKDVFFYVDVPTAVERYPPNHSWKLHDKTTSGVIYYWRDIEGAKKDIIKNEDLYFDKWPKTRIRKEACLPLLYATGYRFIRLSKAGPAGFKCAPLPVNLATAQTVKSELAKKRIAERKAAKKAKKEAKKQAKKEAKLKKK